MQRVQHVHVRMRGMAAGVAGVAGAVASVVRVRAAGANAWSQSRLVVATAALVARSRRGFATTRAPPTAPAASAAAPAAPATAPSTPPDATSKDDVAAASAYQKKTQREHILLRPEPYIGSMHKDTRDMWVYNASTRSMELRTCTFVPALVHIVDEILVNAADNKHRNTASSKMSAIHVTVRPYASSSSSSTLAPFEISVCNDGASIPVLMHPQEHVYVPELIFGHLLTSSNYNDQERRLTGGRHGFGAKLTNIFSSRFVVEVQDAKRQLRYRQVFSQNMTQREPPVITTFAELAKATGTAAGGSATSAPRRRRRREQETDGAAPATSDLDDSSSSSDDATAAHHASSFEHDLTRSYTKISFVPDLERFAERTLTADTLGLIQRRVFDLAACVSGDKVHVYLNDERVPVDSFASYISLYPPPEDGSFVYTSVNPHWQVAVGPSIAAGATNSGGTSTSTGGGGGAAAHAARDISFVNSIATTRGGTHVNFVADKLVRHIMEYMAKHYKHLTNVTWPIVRANISLFVNCAVPNPSFDSQTKETLITPWKDLGTEWSFSNTFLQQVVRDSGIVEAVAEACEIRQKSELAKKTRVRRGRALNIPKLDDANLAGTDRSSECTLILTEGDSAKALVLAGLSILGRDKFGVFPLRGKMLNVRDASHDQILKNEEINHVVQIVGLQYGKVYDTPESRSELRYGRVMLMTDQDHDGSHIKGLFINMVDTFWPHLLRTNGFLEQFVTAIIKATRGKEVKVFHSMPEYETWKASIEPSELKRWSIKYYKGLGTNTAEEGKAYFRELGKHRIEFLWGGAEDAQLLDMAFSKDKADERKAWLARFQPGQHVDHSQRSMTYNTFINKELILFSNADNIRSLPSVIDGLKPAQRKVLFACFKRDLVKEIKVAQLAGYVSEQAGYHHGEVSLHGTIVNMAQDFVGSNNLPLLVPSGQFGTRHLGGKDSASARYIFTRLAPITRLLFPAQDDVLLPQRDEDGLLVEPEWYAPIIPMALVNGCEGIGTGFSTLVPSYNPLDLVAHMRHRLRASSPQSTPPAPLVPWFHGFTGRVSPAPGKPGVWITEGRIAKANDRRSVIISELPVGRWTQDYKEFLVQLASPDARSISIRRFTEHHSNEHVKFRVELTAPQMMHAEDVGFVKAFKLSSTVSTQNMHMFDAHGKIKRYADANEVLDEFFPVRLALYERRRQHMLAVLGMEYRRASNRERFVTAVLNNELVVFRRKRAEIVQQLQRDGYATASQLKATAGAAVHRDDAAAVRVAEAVAQVEEDEVEEQGGAGGGGVSREFDYLIQMPLNSFTAEKVAELQRECAQKQRELETLRKKSAADLWVADLDALEQRLRTSLDSSAKAAAAGGEASA